MTKLDNLVQDGCLPTAADVDFFDKNGYWVSPAIFSAEQLEAIKEHQDRIYREDFETGIAPICNWSEGVDNPRSLRKTDNSHWSDSVLRGVATDPTIGAIAGKLMHADTIRLWHDQLLYKPGRGPGKETANVGWHQDFAYWQLAKEPTLITAWVAFTDVDLSNGCMQMVPRSHRWGLLKMSDFFEQNMEKLQDDMDIPENEKFTKEPIVMKAGQVSFHHALTIHGSGPNTTDEARRSMAVHLMTGETRYAQSQKGDLHFNSRFMQGRDGELFDGDAFPVLYRA